MFEKLNKKMIKIIEKYEGKELEESKKIFENRVYNTKVIQDLHDRINELEARIERLERR